MDNSQLTILAESAGMASRTISSRPLEALIKDSGTASLDEIREQTNQWINNQGPPSEQLRGVQEIFDLACDFRESCGEVILEAWSIFRERKLWANKYQNETDALAAVDNEVLKSIRNMAKCARTRKQKSAKMIQKNWGLLTKYWAFDSLGEHYLNNVAHVSESWSFADASIIVGQIAIRRLNTVQQGRGSSRRLITKDWGAVQTLTKEEAESMLLKGMPSMAELQALEMTIIDLDLSRSQMLIAPDHVFGAPTANPQTPERKGRRRYRKRLRLQDRPSEIRESQGNGHVSLYVEKSIGGDQDINHDSDHFSESGELSPNSTETTSDDEPRRKDTMPGSCHCQGVPEVLKERLELRSKVSAGLETTDACITMLRKLRISRRGRRSLSHACYKHLVSLGRRFSLRTTRLKRPQLEKLLNLIWDNRGDLNAFMTAPDSFQFFRLRERPPVPDDDLGITGIVPNTIVEELAGPDAMNKWLEDGNLIVKGIFSWLWDGIQTSNGYEPGVGDLIDQEFEAYLWHQRERNGEHNKGWLRTMYHSLSQQIVRQDLGYWLLYACLRPDRSPRLVSYPYYVKYASQGDTTRFRHIDMNVSMFLRSGHGGNIIQGSVSFDDETPDGCTEIIPGFHRKIEDWWRRVESRGNAPDGAVHNLESIYLQEDSDNLGDFIPVPCNRGDVRITKPEIVHGSTASQGPQIRRTILPWFVGVRADGETLDNRESDTWSTIAKCHIKQEAPKLTPSGLPNRFGPIPFRFPASVSLNIDNPVSQALVCKMAWDDPVVQAYANLLLGADRLAAQKEIIAVRVQALRAFRLAFDQMVATEKVSFGPNSYFASRHRDQLR